MWAAWLCNMDGDFAQQQLTIPCYLFGAQVDLYSFGVILWELITTEVPRRGRLRAIKARLVLARCIFAGTHHSSVLRLTTTALC